MGQVISIKAYKDNSLQDDLQVIIDKLVFVKATCNTSLELSIEKIFEASKGLNKVTNQLIENDLD